MCIYIALWFVVNQLITTLVRECHLFSDTVGLAMRIFCYGIFNNNFNCKFSRESVGKKYWQSVKVWWSYSQEFGVSVFLWNSVYKKLSYYRGTARARCVSWDFVNDWANVRKTALKNARNRWMAFSVIQRIGASQLDTFDFLLVFHCNYVRISCTDIDTYMPKFLKRSRDTDHALFGGCLSSRSSHFIWPINVQITKFEVVSLCRYI